MTAARAHQHDESGASFARIVLSRVFMVLYAKKARCVVPCVQQCVTSARKIIFPLATYNAKKGIVFFFLNGTPLATIYVISQFWHTHTHGGGTGQNATLKHFENE